MEKDTARRTVLVVDDETDIRETIVEYLRAQGIAADEASNGLDALLHVRRARPDAIVLDLIMPRLGGLDVLKRIRAFAPEIRIAVITGAEDAELHRQATLLGAVAVLQKPFDLADLLTATTGLTPSGADASEAGQPAPPASPAREERSSLGNILVVDDESEICEILEEYLAHQGYRVRTAADGATALRAVTEEAPDVVLLDINMPRLSGIEALTAIQAINPDIQVIMVSGQSDLERAKQSLAYGAFDYITKPFGLPYLTQSVETAIVMRGFDQS